MENTVEVIEKIGTEIEDGLLYLSKENKDLRQRLRHFEDMKEVYRIKLKSTEEDLEKIKRQVLMYESEMSMQYSSLELISQLQEEVTAQKMELDDKNEQLLQQKQNIDHSIKAALSIQQAILPSRNKAGMLLKDYFLIYKPKDTVSGDTWWIDKVGSSTVIVVADCTGHGIPGAFMALIANNIFDKVIRNNTEIQPHEVINQIHDEIRFIMNQDENKNDYGMDLGIIVIDKLNENYLKVQYCGAKRPLFYIKDNETEVKKVDGIRRSVGGEQNENILFVTTNLILHKNSKLYLFSDGLVDQNNIAREKYTQNRLLDILQKNHQETLENQKNILEKDLTKFMQGSPQRDDIVFLGLSL